MRSAMRRLISSYLLLIIFTCILAFPDIRTWLSTMVYTDDQYDTVENGMGISLNQLKPQNHTVHQIDRVMDTFTSSFFLSTRAGMSMPPVEAPARITMPIPPPMSSPA